MRRIGPAILAAVLLVGPANADEMRTHPRPGLGGYDVPFFPNATYRDDVQSPGDFLGYPLGSKPASHQDIVRYLEYLNDTFPNASLATYGLTYEGRELVYLAVSSEKNMARIDEIRANNAKLADPRLMGGSGEAKAIIETNPAIAWMGYGIHGDELSSCDAALQLAYQLLAGTDPTTREIMDNTIVLIDPLQNPDGRTRWLAQLEQWNPVVTNWDVQSLQHRGTWPWGRTNHYLFDLNRDWFTLVHPESRGKTKAILEWMPQYLLDAHEMGPTNTYLFSPPREPFNRHMTRYIRKWWARIAEDHAAAFDGYGWAYYTREWNEEFFPGYGSSWSIYLGAIGMLFEQAGVDGSQVKRPEGTVMTYRESVHHQFLASMTNLTTVAQGRKELLGDYYSVKRDNLGSRSSAYIFPPIADRTRFERFVDKLKHQKIEVERATSEFKVSKTHKPGQAKTKKRTFPVGTAIVRTNQPLRQLIDVILAFDLPIPTSFLELEKKEILKHNKSKLYETTAWSLPVAYGLDAYFTESLPGVKTEDFITRVPRGGLRGEESSVGFVFDCADERAFHLLARLFEQGYRVRSARSPFKTADTEFSRGSFQIRYSDNPDLDPTQLRDLGEQEGVDIVGIDHALGTGRFADLGGQEFELLEAPRIAIVGGSSIRSYNFGAIWHLLDSRFTMRVSTLDAQTLGRIDLDKYNVLVLPHSSTYKKTLGKPGIKQIKDWVAGGGTLIAEGGAAAFCADTSSAISSVRQRRQSLEKLSLYADALDMAKRAESPEVDSLTIWDAKEADAAPAEKKEFDLALEKIKQHDEAARKLFPRGTILSVDLDDEHWLTIGCDNSVPVLFNTSYAYLTRGPIEVPGRLAPAARMRIGGLLWDEARLRWGETAYLTRESRGKGQVILFATLPNFRGYFHGAERLLLNALFLGPGFGAQQATEW